MKPTDTLVCRQHFFEPRIALSSLLILMIAYIGVLTYAFINVFELGIAYVLTTAFAGLIVVIFTPLLLGSGYRECILTNDAISIIERPLTILSLVIGSNNQYAWRNIEAWREVSVFASLQEPCRAIELHTNANVQYKLWGKWLYVNDNHVTYTQFKQTLQSKLNSIAEQNAIGTRAKPLMIPYIFTTLAVLCVAAFAVVIAQWFINQKLQPALLFGLGMGSFIFIRLAAIYYKR